MGKFIASYWIDGNKKSVIFRGKWAYNAVKNARKYIDKAEGFHYTGMIWVDRYK